MVFYTPVIAALRREMEINQYNELSTTQIELWKTTQWRIPQRLRVGATLWDAYSFSRAEKEIRTHFGTCSHGLQTHRQRVSGMQNYNFGFCFNAKTMLYKHLLALDFSKHIGDSIPSETWYRDKWLNWTPYTKDLEIAERWKHMIPCAEPYIMPDEMMKQLARYERST